MVHGSSTSEATKSMTRLTVQFWRKRRIRQVVRNTYGLMDTKKIDVTDCDTLLKENTI